MRRALLEALLAARAAGRPFVLATWLASGEQRSFEAADLEAGALESDLLEAARAALRDDRSGTFQTARGEVFVHVFNPPPRLVVVGAVHISQPLVRLAQVAEFEVVVVDPRRAFATATRFPGVTLLTDWPDKALASLELGRRTAVVTLTHDPKLDDPALSVALESAAFYIGALGSRRTHTKRLERLRARGFDEAALARIHGPVGLALGARTPAEIAVAILAQVIAALRAEAA